MIQQGNKVIITGQAGLAKTYPAFHKGFVGKTGEVTATRLPTSRFTGKAEHVQIKIDTEHIWCRKDWVTKVQ